MESHDPDWCNVANRALHSTWHNNRLPLDFHPHFTGASTGKGKPILLGFHPLKEVVETNLVAADNRIDRNVTLIFDDDAESTIHTIMNEHLDVFVPNGVVGSLELFGNLNFLAVEEENCIRTQSSQQRLLSVKVFGLMNREGNNAGCGVRWSLFGPVVEFLG